MNSDLKCCTMKNVKCSARVKDILYGFSNTFFGCSGVSVELSIVWKIPCFGVNCYRVAIFLIGENVSMYVVILLSHAH